MAQSLAERYRAARLAFEAGMQMGCTPRDAAAKLRWQDADRRLQAKRHADERGTALTAAIEPERQEPWYRQGDMA